MKMNFAYIHACAALSIFALWGYLETNNEYLIICSVASFFGALCFTFVRLFRAMEIKKDGIRDRLT